MNDILSEKDYHICDRLTKKISFSILKVQKKKKLISEKILIKMRLLLLGYYC